MECHLDHVCVPTHVCTCIQMYVHEDMFECTIRVAKEKKNPYQIVGLTCVLTYMYMCEW